MLKSTVLLFFVFIVAVHCQDARPVHQQDISEDEMNQPCPVYTQPPYDVCPANCIANSADTDCNGHKNQTCCSDPLCGDVCKPKMTMCVNTTLFIKFATQKCLADFLSAIAAFEFDEYCRHLNKGLVCILQNYELEDEIHKTECLARMKAYVKYRFDDVISQLRTIGIPFNETMVSRSELCITGQCRPGVCSNQGSCVELYDSYKCNCSTSAYETSEDGKSCSSVVGVNLKTNNMIKITYDEPRHLPVSVGVEFRTKKKQGLLMMMTNTAGPRHTISLLINNNGGVKLTLNAEFERFEINTLVDTDVSDGKPHKVNVRVDKADGKVYIRLDRHEPLVQAITFADGLNTMDDFKYLYIGNNDTSVYQYGFEGCISSMHIDRFFPLKTALTEPTPSNVMLSPTGDIVKSQCDFGETTDKPESSTKYSYSSGSTNGYGSTTQDSYGNSDEEWNQRCPVFDNIDTDICPKQCDQSCSKPNDACCSIGSTDCTLCIPDMRQCANISVIKTKVRPCASQVKMALASVENADFCTKFWSAMKCIANEIAGESYNKMCQVRMVDMMTKRKVNVLFAFNAITGVQLTDTVRQFYRTVVKCPGSPVYVEPNRPRPKGVDQCSVINTIVSNGRSCIEKLEKTDGTLCSKLKTFVQCITFKIYPEEREGSIKLRQCGDEIMEVIRENIERLKTTFRPLGRINIDDCEEREIICGGKSLEDVDCPTQRCPANYECQKGHCCPVERPGKCPKRSGSPLCLHKCNKDSDCEDEKKCCNMGCGHSTCEESVMYEKSSCELELDNAKKLLQKNGLCGDGKSAISLPRCLDNGGYDPIQGDIANGLLYCVDEKGKKIQGSDFQGNRDCTTVRPGKCPVKPDVCTTGSQTIQSCKSDHDCTVEGQKCCYGSHTNICVRRCVDPIIDNEDVIDSCMDRKCCPINLCNGKICSKDPSAVCRINSCGDCSVEFYNAKGELVDCEEGVSDCEKTRAKAKENNKDKRDGGEDDNGRLENFLKSLVHRRNASRDDIMDEDDQDNDKDFENDAEDGVPTGRSRLLAEGTLCHLFDSYGLCKNGSNCILGKGESTWEICNCSSTPFAGMHGLFCDKSSRLVQLTQCFRDQGRIVDLLAILENAAKVKENKALHTMFNALKIPFIIEPSCGTLTDNYIPVQKALALPRTSKAKDFYVCVEEVTGKRIEYTPISFNASQPPDCTIINNMYPDILSVSKKCAVPRPGNCLTEDCDYYWNLATGKCEKGYNKNGFPSPTECYDACTVKQACAREMATSERTNTVTDTDDCTLVFGAGPLPCQSADNSMKSDCNFTTEFCNVTDDNGVQTGQCESFPKRCLLPPDSGVGNKSIGMYAFDAKQRRCVKVVYKGEGGNKNRFEKVHQCNTECSTRKYKYDDFACPPPKSLVKSGGAECNEDYDCPGDNVCCSDGTKRVCTMHVKTCSYGQRCPVDGAYCDNGKCVCLDCTDAEMSPVCGSDGETYDSECHLKQHVCKTLKPITKQSDGECPADICQRTDCDSTSTVCGRGQLYGALRTFTSECAMNQESCNGADQYMRVSMDDCNNNDAECVKVCTMQYDPVCAYVQSTDSIKLKTYSNECFMDRDMICGNNKIQLLHSGVCEEKCGESTCQAYEQCLNGMCGCKRACTKEYRPVCAYNIGNPDKLEEFANDCLRKNHSCTLKAIYVIKNYGPCKKPEPVYECPRTKRGIARSATFQCNDVTNAFCDKDTEKCCPYGAGRRCVPKNRLIRSTKQKKGECPVQSLYNTDRDQCQHRCRDDSDCAGDAKCCTNMICGFKTCVAPTVRDESQLCGENLRMVENVTCDPWSSDTGCPFGTCTQVTLQDGTKDAVCCASVFLRAVGTTDIMGTRLCQHLKNVNVTCQNGGKCAANLTSGTICKCQDGYYGLFCERKPKPVCEPRTGVNCYVSPCEVSKCAAYPGATCTDNYCSGCDALYTYEGTDVTAKCKETVCLRRKSLFEKISDILKRAQANRDELLRRVGEASREDDDDNDEDDDDDENDDVDSFIKDLLEILPKIPGYVGFPNETIYCTDNGDFAEKQCVKNKKGFVFCYCANATTGEQLPRTRRTRTMKELDCTITKPKEEAPDFCHDETPDMTTVCDETETLRFYFDSKDLRCKGFKDKGCNTDLKNNFNSYKTCQSVCNEQSSRDSKCATVRCAQYTVCVEIGDSAQCISIDDAYGEYEPVCEEDGKYAVKQCNNDACECVDPDTGDQIPDSVTNGELLQCVIVGDEVKAEKTGDKECPDNRRATFCEDSGDSCRECNRRENGRNDGETAKLTDDQGGDEDEGQDRPNKVKEDGTCATCNTCSIGTKRKVCDATCKQTVCKNFPSAICEVNKCTCEEEFIANGKVIDCNKAHPVCNRTKHAQRLTQIARRLGMTNNAQEDEEEEIICGEDGVFEKKCTGSRCVCLDATNLVPVGEMQNRNTINCASALRATQPKIVDLDVKASARDIKLTARKTQAFKESFKKKFDAFKRFLDRNLKLMKIDILAGSVMVNLQLSCEGECVEIDLYSQASFLVSQINTETEDIEVDGETFTLSDASIVKITTEQDLYGQVTEPTSPEDDDDNSITIIVVVVVLVVVLIVAVAVAAYCYMKKNKSKNEEMPFTDLRGQDNPTYKS